MRLTLHVGGYRLAPHRDAAGDGGGGGERGAASTATSTWMAAVTCLDPGGSVPTAVVNATAKKRALVVEKVRTLPTVADRARWAPLPPAMMVAAAASATVPELDGGPSTADEGDATTAVGGGGAGEGSAE